MPHAQTRSSVTAPDVAHVVTGAIGTDIEGRALIIHDFNGARIACALLEPVWLGSHLIAPHLCI